MTHLPKQFSSFRQHQKWYDPGDHITSRCNMEATRLTTASGLEDIGGQDLSKKPNGDERSFAASTHTDSSALFHLQTAYSIPEFDSKFIRNLNLASSKSKVPAKMVRRDPKVILSSEIILKTGRKQPITSTNLMKHKREGRFTSQTGFIGRVIISCVDSKSESVNSGIQLDAGNKQFNANCKGAFSQRQLTPSVNQNYKRTEQLSCGERSAKLLSPFPISTIPTNSPSKWISCVPRIDIESATAIEGPHANETLDEARFLDSDVSSLNQSTPKLLNKQLKAQENLLNSRKYVFEDPNSTNMGSSFVKLPKQRVFKNLLSLPTAR
jgi:hypothetical protein